MKKSIKQISVMLVIAILFTVIPQGAIVFGEEIEEASTQVQAQETVAAEPEIVGEDITRRDIYTKHFRMSDGTVMAAQYSEPVHYEKDGQLLDIDNTLKDSIDRSGKAVSVNTANGYRVEYQKNASNGNVYTYIKDDISLKVSIDGIKSISHKKEQKTQSRKVTNKEKMSIEKASSKVTYNNAFENIDIEYITASDKIKENIIINKKTNISSITYTYEAEGLSAEQIDTKTVALKINAKEFVRLEAPIMFDSNENVSQNLSLTIIPSSVNKVKVKLSWDSEWINKKDIVYPVTIDPILWDETTFATKENIKETYVNQAAPNERYNGLSYMKVGKSTSSNENQIYVRFVNLPTLRSGDKVVKSQLALVSYYLVYNNATYDNANSFSPVPAINAYQITSDWRLSTETAGTTNPICWNSRPSDTGKVLDYENVATNAVNDWDITSAVEHWYNNPSENYGIVLKMNAPTASQWYFYYGTSDQGITDLYPQLVVQYINTTGLEGYFSNHSQSVGHAGTVYTNDMTGNMTLVNSLVTMGGNIMPVNATLVYNTNDTGTNLGYGNGWKLNTAQSIKWASLENANGVQYAMYKDSDGTEHYFTCDPETGIWTDETNPARKVYYDMTTQDYTMKDDSGTRLVFTRKPSTNEWYLYKIYDSNDNWLQMTLDSSNLNKVKAMYNSSNKRIDLTYNSAGNLGTITYNDDNNVTKTITLSYEGNNISSITFADGATGRYGYKDGTNLIDNVTDHDGYRVEYDYTSGSIRRVNSIKEYGSSGTLGQQITMTYGVNSTVFRDVTNNRKYLYTFSSLGTLKSSVDITENDGNGYGQYYEYNEGRTETTGKGNLTQASKTQKSTVNLIKNHSFEADGSYYFIVHGDNTVASSGGISSEKSHIGSKSYKITRPLGSTGTRALGYYHTSIKGGQTYTLSAYVNTANMNVIDKGASLYVLTETESFESEYYSEKTGANEWKRLSVTFTPSVDSTVSLCMNLSGATGSVYFDNIQLETGGLSDYNLLENAGFEDGTTSWWASTPSVVSIDSAEKASGTKSLKMNSGPTIGADFNQRVYISGAAGDTYVASAFSKAESIPASGWKYTLLVRFHNTDNTTQDVNILFNSDTKEWQKISGVAKAEKAHSSITVWLLYYDNANTVYFDNAQLIKDTFGNTYTYDSKGNLTSTVDLQGKAENTFQYDGNSQLIKESSITGSSILYAYSSTKKQQLEAVTASGVSNHYTYDSKGNVTSAFTMGNELVDGKSYYIQNVYYSKFLNVSGTSVGLADFAENSAQRWKLIKNTDGSVSFSPESASSKLLSVNGSTLANSVNLGIFSSGEKPYQKFTLARINSNLYCLDITQNTNYAIDSNGTSVYTYTAHHGEIQQFALIPAENSNTSSNPAIISSATFTSNGDYTNSVTDSRGNTVSYNYGDNRGLLYSATDAMGNVTSYTYYDNELLKNVSMPNGTQTPTVSYAYDTYKKLTGITSPSGTNYSFTYDSFSRGDTVKIGTRTLSDYLYDNKGRVESFEYGNGTKVEYGYDKLNRQTTTTINNVLRYNKLYDGISRLMQIDDILLGKSIKYEYDILDRAVGEKLINTQTNKVYAQLGIRYDDSKNRVAGYDVNIEGINKATDFVYGGNNVAPDIITSVKHNNTTKLSYGYDSLNRLITRSLATSTPFLTEYTYMAGRTKGSTTDNSALTTTLIKTVKNGNDILEYAYDNLGNITSITKNNILVESYTYDNLNQLKTVTKGTDTWEYFYDNGGNILSVTLNGTEVKEYTYGNSEWKDLLTEYNGQAIDYDIIGNPLTYRDNMSFTWTDGRKLATVTKGTDSIAYTYDSNGLRTSKTVNGVITDYYWLNGMLQGQKTGNEYIIYLYDENGIAYGLLLKNGTTEQYYYYIFNAQGDVIGILDSTGTQVVSYEYDAWGEITATTGTQANTIGQKNPIRYRGYYYDSETGLYYVSSRYYDVEIGRWINADTTDVLTVTPMELTDKNLFAYCDNNPVVRADLGGDFWHIVAGAAIGGVSSFVATLLTGGSIAEAGISALFGAASGALTMALPSAALLIDIGFSVAEEATVNLINKTPSNETMSNIAISAGVDSISSLTTEGSGITKKTMKDFVDAVPKTLKGNHPQVKKAAQRVVKQTSRTIAKETSGTIVGKSIGNFFKNILKAIF